MMKRIVVVAMMIAIATCAPLAAQWIKYPTAGVPTTPNGFPNLGAPAPRTADGAPDLLGIWEAENTRPCPPTGAADNCTDLSVAYANPWTVKPNQYIVLNTELLDYICLENEKDVSHLAGK